MNPTQIIVLVTSLLGVFSFIGMLYDAWSGLKNAGINSELKHEIKKNLIKNIIFGALVLFLIIGMEIWIFNAIS